MPYFVCLATYKFLRPDLEYFKTPSFANRRKRPEMLTGFAFILNLSRSADRTRFKPGVVENILALPEYLLMHSYHQPAYEEQLWER